MRQIILNAVMIGLLGVLAPVMSSLPGGNPSPTIPPSPAAAVNGQQANTTTVPSGVTGDTITGVYVREIEDYYNVIRFYEDGTVLVASIATAPDDICTDWPNIDLWFRKDNPDYPASIGTYHLEGDTITFVASSDYGDVDYEGTVTGTELVLDIYSHINGNLATDRHYKSLESLCDFTSQ